ncbi:hypothetical protein DL89DRAFT_97838 [Linderina pennispora]|uniref:Uncharacterized protein n=1 Tax=Linderina pennispora TaxID=61395 RepID=A0A1Y1VWJ1_9FUNG|nr:uncharacterized protein DL89DRAFT_97838 [Linderina pennispora]ORX65659.1 hypothetical protein DL89DRAFT_97838 [Linderina pennispora]
MQIRIRILSHWQFMLAQALAKQSPRQAGRQAWEPDSRATRCKKNRDSSRHQAHSHEKKASSPTLPRPSSCRCACCRLQSCCSLLSLPFSFLDFLTHQHGYRRYQEPRHVACTRSPAKHDQDNYTVACSSRYCCSSCVRKPAFIP